MAARYKKGDQVYVASPPRYMSDLPKFYRAEVLECRRGGDEYYIREDGFGYLGHGVPAKWVHPMTDDGWTEALQSFVTILDDHRRTLEKDLEKLATLRAEAVALLA